ncbi:MAG: hypothetical protein JW843_07085 [Candidatus Aminicenantes bacterium]|nr:hypothetical protein [Candidatus Aminicenantes bacterium]
MKKTGFVFLIGAVLLLSAGSAAAQTLRAGEIAIWSGGGVRTIVKIVGISSSRPVIKTAEDEQIPLRDIWMINFVDEGWNFPGERTRIQSNDLHVFLKNNQVLTPGRIISFSSTQRVFEFENGESIPIGDIRRMYFARTLPGDLAAQVGKPEPAPGPGNPQTLRAGEIAIWSGGGIRVIDNIIGISSTRPVIKTTYNGEIPLRDTWMINFVNDGWNFPGERNRIQSDDLHVFLKNNQVLTPGRIISFSSSQRVFEFESGESIPFGDVRRIYFTKSLPGDLAAQLGQADPAPTPEPDERFIGDYERLRPAPPIRLLLRADGTSRMEVPRFPNGPAASRNLVRILNGEWEATGSDRVTVRFERTGGNRWAFVYVFILDEGDLVATGEARRMYGDLRLNRR